MSSIDLDQEARAKRDAFEWIDIRIETLERDLHRIEGKMMQKIGEHWIEDFREAGRTLATSKEICEKYHGKWKETFKRCSKNYNR